MNRQKAVARQPLFRGLAKALLMGMAFFASLRLEAVQAAPTVDPAKFAPPRILEDSQAQGATAPAPDVLFFGSDRIYPKDPQAAFCFSLVVPGLGHLYSQSYTRGMIAAAGFGVGLAVLINNAKVVPDPADQSHPRRVRNLTGVQVTAPILMAWYLFTAQDARAQARRYNKKLGFRFAVTAQGPALDLRF